jgi:UDP-N-acetylmuramoyl-tripeptide--D-alanyl-D-alanine ligase
MILSTYLPLTIFFLIGFKQFNLWMYLWQLKEYRGDKMMDYLNLPESIKVVWDKWTLLRLALVTYYLLFIYLGAFFTGNVNQAALSFFYLISLFYIIEALEFIAKLVIKRGFRGPILSRKAQVHALLSGVVIFLVLPLLTIDDVAVVNIVTLTTVLLFIPLIIGYWLLVLFPLDYYIKLKLFKKARAHREDFDDLEVIAVSGAYGKTSTKSFLNQLLSTKHRVIFNKKNQNSNVSCARWTLKVTEKIDFFICELGAYKRGDGAEIAKFVRPTSAIITGLNHQHYSLFGSEENIIKTESESLDFLPEGSVAAINWSSPMCRKIAIPNTVKVIKYGVKDGVSDKRLSYDIYAEKLDFDGEWMTFDLVADGKKRKMKTNVVGRGNVENLVGSIALARHYKLSWKEIEKLLTSLEPAEGTLAITKKKWGVQVDDSYNANVDGVKNALSVLASYKRLKKKHYTVAFMDDILELGELAPRAHQQIAQALIDNKVDEVFLTGRNFATYIAQFLVQKGYDPMKIHTAHDTYRVFAGEILKKILKSKKPVALLLEGKQSEKYLPLL